MNGLASAPSLSQSLLQPPENFAAGPVDTVGAGSTTISDPQPSPQDSSSSIDRQLDSTAATNIIPNGLSTSDTQKPATGSQPEGGLVQHAEVIDDRQDKGGAAEKEGAQAEPLVIKDDLLEAAVNGQIELLEHTPESGVGTGLGMGLIVNEDGHWVPDGDYELKRVKVRKVCHLISHPSFRAPVAIYEAHLVIEQSRAIGVWDCVSRRQSRSHYPSSMLIHLPGLRTRRFSMDGSRDSLLFRSILRRQHRRPANRPFGKELQRCYSINSHSLKRRVSTTARWVMISFDGIPSRSFCFPVHTTCVRTLDCGRTCTFPFFGSVPGFGAMLILRYLCRNPHRMDRTRRRRLCAQLSRSRRLPRSMEFHPRSTTTHECIW